MRTTTQSKNDLRRLRHARIRGRLAGSAARPRLAVFKSNQFISAQLIDDEAGTTLAAAHGREFSGSGRAQAEAVGKAVAERAAAVGVSAAVFDRGGYHYGAQIAALAEAARAGGLRF